MATVHGSLPCLQILVFYSILFYSIPCCNQSILELVGLKTGRNGLEKREKLLPLPEIEPYSPCSSGPQASHYTKYATLVPCNLILTEINYESKRE